MAIAFSRRVAALATLVTVLGIMHGSLWPYDFRPSPDGRGPIAVLLASWTESPSGRGDILANILFYMPLGFSAAIALPGRRAGRLLLTVLGGAMLSLAMELTQYYDADRTTSLYDLSTNTIGTAIGAIAALMLGVGRNVPLLGALAANPVPTMLLLAMLGFRLVPYVPVIDLHKYWDALKPLVFGPGPDLAASFHYCALWLTAGELLIEVFGRLQGLVLAPLLVGFVLASKVAIAGSEVTRSEVVGAALAVLLALPVLGWVRGRAAVVALVLGASVMIDRLQPFAFDWVGRPFGWLPFRSFLGGSLIVNTASFMEKVFLYGSLLWLLARAGLRPILATTLVAALVLGTSVAETMLPERSGEITDTLMVLLVAFGFALLHPKSAPPTPARAAIFRIMKSP